MKWLAIGGVAVGATLGVWLLQPSDWRSEQHANLASATALTEQGALPGNLPPESREIALRYHENSGAAFLRLTLPPHVATAYRTELIPVGRATAVALAMRHPDELDEWDEVTLSARLRTGTMSLRRLRDGSRWYLIVQDDGQVWGWHAPDVEPAPATR